MPHSIYKEFVVDTISEKMSRLITKNFPKINDSEKYLVKKNRG